MSSPFLSVIIPTYNRANVLEKCLRALQSQSLAKESFEVLVVDDGSSDFTPELLKKWTEGWPNLKALHQKNAGQGNARNKALKEATGQVILFIGDDIFAAPDFLEKHATFHQDHPEKTAACLGLTEWDPEQPITPFMKWLTHGGPQFAYHHLMPEQEASFWYFYTSNISLKKDMLLEDSFDPDFKAYGWEDIELGYRLMQKGLKLIYTPSAFAVHDHFMEPSSLKKRMINVGKSAVLFQKKQPDVKVLPTGFKKYFLRLVSSAPFLVLAFPFRRLYWTLLTKRYLLEGIRSI
ncbi:MAG: glycosyltransferase family 2 protein [Patescibacteria group bacterium]